MSDPSEDQTLLISVLLHWIWNCRLQVARLVESTRLELSTEEPASQLAQAQTFSRTSYDEHLVLVAGRHVVSAVELVEKTWAQFTIASDLRESLCLLRNVYEHWDDPLKGIPLRSLSKFQARFSEGRPNSIAYGSEDWIIAGVVSIRRLMETLDRLEAAAVPISPWNEETESP